MKRIRYNRADLNDTMRAAKQLAYQKPVFVFATYCGYTIDKNPPPFGQRYYRVSETGEVAFSHPQDA